METLSIWQMIYISSVVICGFAVTYPPAFKATTLSIKARHEKRIKKTMTMEAAKSLTVIVTAVTVLLPIFNTYSALVMIGTVTKALYTWSKSKGNRHGQ